MKQIIATLQEQDELFSTYEGCSEKEIAAIEAKISGYSLPSVYKTFLATMGKNAGNFMLGSSEFYDELGELKEAVIELLEDNNFKVALPKDAFVFWMHQGYQFAFFTQGTEKDPKVYYYGEGEGLKDFKVINSFTEFLRIQLELSGFKP